MELPSKELLSEVLGEEVKDLELWKQNNIRYFSPKDYIINIYELAHKCKEWAYKNKYDIWSITWGSVEFLCTETYKGTERIDADTEPEAIFRACEYILQQRNN